MSKIAQMLQTEIARLAAKEVKSLKKDVASLKKEVARLSKLISATSKGTTVPKRAVTPRVAAESTEEAGQEVSMRLSPGLIKKLRVRLQVSQVELAKLVGVSQPAVASWEQGRAKPRGPARTSIAALRGLSATQAQQKLQGESPSEPGISPEGKPKARRGRKPKSAA